MCVASGLLLLEGCADGLEPLYGDMSVDSVLEIDPEGDLSFGEVSTERSEVRALTLYAVGDTVLTIQRVSFDENTSAAYTLLPLDLPLGIPPNESVDIEIRFSPDYVGTFNGHVEIFDGGRDTTRRLIGFGCDPSAAGCN